MRARSVLECGSSSYRLRFMRRLCRGEGGGCCYRTQGAFGTVIFMTWLPRRERFDQTALGQGEKTCRPPEETRGVLAS
jgi:hypothetical protein